jgi:hypothetical protein
LALTIFYSSLFPGIGFGGETSVAVSRGTFMSAIGIATIAAWDAGRLRRGRVTRSAPLRHPLRVAGDVLAPAVMLAVLCYLAAAAVGTFAVGAAPRWEDAAIHASALSVSVGAAIGGFLLGLALPPLLARPIALVGTAMWIIVTPVMEMPWLRGLSGMLLDSPSYTDALDPQYLLAPTVLIVGLGAGAIGVALLSGRRTLQVAALTGCLLIGAGSAGAMVRGAPEYGVPTIPRTWGTVCEGSAPQICVPQEFAADLPLLRRTTRQVLPRLRAAGIKSPPKLAYVSSETPVGRGTWRISLDSPVSRQQALARITRATVPTFTSNNCPNLPEDYSDGPGYGAVSAWLGLIAGMTEQRAARIYLPNGVYRARWVRTLPKAEQHRWYRRQLTSIRSCNQQVHHQARKQAKAERTRGLKLGPRLEQAEPRAVAQ